MQGFTLNEIWRKVFKNIQKYSCYNACFRALTLSSNTCSKKLIILLNKITIVINFRWAFCGLGIIWSVASGNHCLFRRATNFFRRKSYRIFDISVPMEITDLKSFGNIVGSWRRKLVQKQSSKISFFNVFSSKDFLNYHRSFV